MVPALPPVPAQGHLQQYMMYTAISAAIPAVMGAVFWAIKNPEVVLNISKTAHAATDCIFNSKGIKSQKEDCFSAMDYIKNHVVDLKSIDLSNRKETREKIERYTNNLSNNDIAIQMFNDINERTQLIWNSSHMDTKFEMQKRIRPFFLSIQDIPKSSLDLVSWVQETVSCNEDRRKCILEKNEAEQGVKKAKDEIIQLQKDFKLEKDPLLERKGECKDLEGLKIENSRLEKVEDEYILIKEKCKDLEIIKTENNRLKKVEDEHILIKDKCKDLEIIKTENNRLEKIEKEHILINEKCKDIEIIKAENNKLKEIEKEYLKIKEKYEELKHKEKQQEEHNKKFFLRRWIGL